MGDRHVLPVHTQSMVTRRIRTQGDDGPITYGYKFRPVFLGQGAE